MSVVLNKGGQAAADAHVRPRAQQENRLSTLASFVDQARRSIGQVALFAVFGLGGAVVSAAVVPALFLIKRDRPARVAAMRHVVQRLLAAYTGSMQGLRLIHLEWEGIEHLQRRGVLIVANHPTLIDAFFLLGKVDQLVPIAKRALLANPFTGAAIRAADYQPNDDGPALVEACCERLGRGESLLVFPEATRTGRDGAIRLRRGAAQVAVRSGCPVVVVAIRASEQFLTRDTRWWLAPKSAPRFRIKALPPLDPARFLAASITAEASNGMPALAARRLTETLRALYSRELT